MRSFSCDMKRGAGGSSFHIGGDGGITPLRSVIRFGSLPGTSSRAGRRRMRTHDPGVVLRIQTFTVGTFVDSRCDRKTIR